MKAVICPGHCHQGRTDGREGGKETIPNIMHDTVLAKRSEGSLVLAEGIYSLEQQILKYSCTVRTFEELEILMFGPLPRDADLIGVLVSWGCHSKVPQTGCLKQEGFIYSQFCRLEVRYQSAGLLGFS